MSATLLFDRCLTGWALPSRAARIAHFHQSVTRSTLLDRCLTGRGVRVESRSGAEPPARPNGDRPAIRRLRCPDHKAHAAPKAQPRQCRRAGLSQPAIHIGITEYELDAEYGETLFAQLAKVLKRIDLVRSEAREHHALAEYALAGAEYRLFVSKYLLELRQKDAMQRVIDEQLREVEE